MNLKRASRKSRITNDERRQGQDREGGRHCGQKEVVTLPEGVHAARYERHAHEGVDKARTKEEGKTGPESCVRCGMVS
jgi:hypothetical protein